MYLLTALLIVLLVSVYLILTHLKSNRLTALEITEPIEEVEEDGVSYKELTNVLNLMLQMGVINFRQYNELHNKSLPFVK